MNPCFLFPGQGAQFVKMAYDFYSISANVRNLFQEASEASEIDLKKLLFEGSEEDLRQTKNTQISVVLAGLSAADYAKEKGILAKYCAGFSVGEWAALAYSGIISYYDTFKLVALRSSIMDKAGREAAPSTMSAIIGLSPELIEEAIKKSGLKNIWIANYNSPSQSVISGFTSEIEEAEKYIKEAGAKRAIRLKVSAAFHCPIMSKGIEVFQDKIKNTKFSEPKISIFSNVNGKQIKTAEEAKNLAQIQITSPVRWLDEEKSIAECKPSFCVETGPGSVLTGLWKAIENNIVCYPCSTVEQLSLISI